MSSSRHSKLIDAARRKIKEAAGFDHRIANMGANVAAALGLEEGAGCYWIRDDGSYCFVHADVAKAIEIIRAIKGAT